MVTFSCDPANVGKLTDAVLATVAALQKTPVDQGYLDKVKELLVRYHETNLRENGWWIRALAEAWRFGDDPLEIPQLDPVLARLTPANVQAAAKKYLSGKDTVLAVLKPAETKPPQP